MMAFEKMENVDGITQHQPSPTYIGTQLHTRLRREHNLLSVFVAQRVRLIGVRILQHDGVIIVLGLDVFFVNTTEILDNLIHLVEKRLFLLHLRGRRNDAVFHTDAVGRNKAAVSISADGYSQKHHRYEKVFQHHCNLFIPHEFVCSDDNLNFYYL